MGIKEELEAMEDKLRGIKAPKSLGAGHNFGKSKLAKQARMKGRKSDGGKSDDD